MEKTRVGKVTHYYSNIGVAVIEVEHLLKQGDKISIEGATTDIQQTANNMQVEHQFIKEAKTGDSIGLKVIERVRPGDVCYKLE